MANNLKLRVKVDGATVSLTGLSDDLTLRGLKEELVKTTQAPWYQHVLHAGFPPREVTGTDDQGVVELKLHKEAILVTKDPSREEPNTPNRKRGRTDAATPSANATSSVGTFTDRVEKSCFPEPAVLPAEFLGPFSREIILADNSCLFNSIISSCQLNKTAAHLRTVVARAVEVDDRFNEVVLEKTVKDYVQWIQKAESWGGYIECLILAEYLQVQVASIHIETLHVAYYPEECDVPYCIYLLHDGIHYDYVKAAGPDNATVRVFSREDHISLARAVDVAKELKQKKQFTNVTGFSLQCQECFTALKGQKEAQEHGKQTGHRNFAQVD